MHHWIEEPIQGSIAAWTKLFKHNPKFKARRPVPNLSGLSAMSRVTEAPTN